MFLSLSSIPSSTSTSIISLVSSSLFFVNADTWVYVTPFVVTILIVNTFEFNSILLQSTLYTPGKSVLIVSTNW